MAARIVFLFLAVLAVHGVEQGTEEQEAAQANPIRKVVTMLQKMQGTVEAEGKKEEELFEKYMCYCKNADETLGAAIEANTAKVPQTQSEIEESESQHAQAESDLKEAQDGRAKAKDSIAQATAVREKEAVAYAKASGDLKTNIAAIKKAVTAIEAGMSGFLQTTAASLVRKVAASDMDLSDYDRQQLTSFLSGGTDSAGSGEITGILKTMEEDMSKDLSDLTATEESAKTNFEELVSAMTKEVEAHTATIERKSKLIGELAVQIVQLKADLTDAEEALIEDKKFLKDLDVNCAAKQKEWDERCKMRQEELLALADTIKMLNSDDALELFKKTLPGSSLLQVKAKADQLRHRALAILKGAKNVKSTDLDLLSLALGAKKADFSKVIKMIEDMVALLKREQVDDDDKKEYCVKQIDLAEDKLKQLKQTMNDLDTSIADHQEAVKTYTADIKSLTEGIKELDKQVAEATEQRKEEHEDFSELMSGNSAAKELIEFAKNRLNKFYNPSQYKAPPEESLVQPQAPTLVQVNAHHQQKKDDPGAPPDADFGSYGKKNEESNGVIGMMNTLIADLDREMTEAQVEEENAQKEYEELMSDSAEKRAEDSKTITQKEKAKADTDGLIVSETEEKKDTTGQYLAAGEYKQQLHGECDWLLGNFDLRKSARSDEIDALSNAKAVLSGADYAFVQEKK
eukprot:gnl/TRDRNA2_/TRDRNA2_176069_c26_seq18.p1 gnl/TRDRNA2_/TRDRNA2_176069_c26~~gnl/TRDRNA2_/TRDRNA2_176069_c26_seq18.p1  ORF type:complete len:687 (+),score=263.06 gnl/TRDRNA2_/TRDRNA2_176069_c26_seq18:55-2115(+)